MMQSVGLAFAALVAGTSVAHATCGWFGTQIACSLGSGQVVVGSQASDHPARVGGLRPSPFQGHDDLVARRKSDAGRWRVVIQDVGRNPTLCRRIGNEAYCY